MTKKIDFEKYKNFVDGVTSEPSKDFLALTERLVELDEKGANIERLMTAAIGLNAESGEFLEIVKKLVYQGKEWNEETKNHLIVELGDSLWYTAQALIALQITIEDALSKNIDKLKKRYPGGAFDAYYSENRDENDI